MSREAPPRRPVYTDRIPVSKYDDDEARAYTAQCVRELTESKSFQSYQRHLDYKDYFIGLWLVAAIALVILFYYHLVVFSDGGDVVFSLATVENFVMENGPIYRLNLVALFASLYVLPCVIVKSYINVLSETTLADSCKTYFCFTILSLFVVCYGGAELHHPPFLRTTPQLPFHQLGTEGVSFGQLLLTCVTRALPLQGFILGGFLVAVWYTSFWNRMWHIPMPLLVMPLLVGAGGAIVWRVCTLTIPYFYSETSGLTSIGEMVQRDLFSDPAEVLAVLGPVLRRVWATLQGDVLRIGSALDLLPGATLYAASFGLSIVFFIVSLLFPVVDYIGGGLLRAVLPSNPLLWCSLLFSFAAGIYLSLHVEGAERYVWHRVTFALLIVALLYNGFRL